MKYRNIVLLLASATLLLGSALSQAAATAAVAPQSAASQAKPSPVAATPAKAEKTANAAAKLKPVDINAATIAQLKALPGIDDAVAAKIIAGRPYGSKAQLVARNIVDAATYGNIKLQIIAKQPFKDAAKNAAQFAPKK